MNNYYWIKLYYELREDPKVHRLSDSAFRRFILLMLLAGEHPDRDGTLPSIEDICFHLRVSAERLQQDLIELEMAGIVEIRGGEPFLKNFEKRQEAKKGKERVRAYRERKRKQEYNANVTPPKRERNDTVTERYTDIDIDIDKDKMYIYAHPDPEPIAKLKTAMSEVTKTAIQFKGEEYDKAAYALSGWDATPDMVRGFAEWWNDNGYYAGKPALKTLINEWQNYAAGVVVVANGNQQGSKPAPEPFEQRQGGAY